MDLIAARAGIYWAGGTFCADFMHLAWLPALHAARSAFSQQHGDDVFSRIVAKQLAFVLFMKRNSVFGQQLQKVLRRVARQCRTAKVRVVA